MLENQRVSITADLVRSRPTQITPAPTRALCRFGRSPLLTQRGRRRSGTHDCPQEVPLTLGHTGNVCIRSIRNHHFVSYLTNTNALTLKRGRTIIVRTVRRILDSRLPLRALSLAAPIGSRFIRSLFNLLPPTLTTRTGVRFYKPANASTIRTTLGLIHATAKHDAILSFRNNCRNVDRNTLDLVNDLKPGGPLNTLLDDNIRFVPCPCSCHYPFNLNNTRKIRIGLGCLRGLLGSPRTNIRLPTTIVIRMIRNRNNIVPTSLS